MTAETVADRLEGHLRGVLASGGLSRLRSTDRPFIANDLGGGSVE
jgi:hypothetical protein